MHACRQPAFALPMQETGVLAAQAKNSAQAARRQTLSLLLAGLPASLLLTGCSSGAESSRPPGVETTHASSGEASGDAAAQGFGPATQHDHPADFRHSLYTPTQIVRLKGRYFIVDCWHHRIIHHVRLDAPLIEWQALDEDLAGPHSIASDGSLYVTEDTGRHALKVYMETGAGHFEQVQSLSAVGTRPHRSIYDESRRWFLVIGSADQSLHVFRAQGTTLVPVFSVHLPQLSGQYCRSITLRDNLLYLVGEQEIVVMRLGEKRLHDTGLRYPLAAPCQGSNDLFFLDDRAGMLTATPGKAFIFSSLDDLVSGKNLIDISGAFRGTPYYISRIADRLFIPEITEYSAIRSHALPDAQRLSACSSPSAQSADVARALQDAPACNRQLAATHADGGIWNALTDSQMLFDSGSASAASLARKAELPT